MHKIGRRRIQKNRNGGKPAECANCREEGIFRVSFQDRFGRIIVTLCERCADKEYKDLQLQIRFE